MSKLTIAEKARRAVDELVQASDCLHHAAKSCPGIHSLLSPRWREFAKRLVQLDRLLTRHRVDISEAHQVLVPRAQTGGVRIGRRAVLLVQGGTHLQCLLDLSEAWTRCKPEAEAVLRRARTEPPDEVVRCFRRHWISVWSFQEEDRAALAVGLDVELAQLADTLGVPDPSAQVLGKPGVQSERRMLVINHAHRTVRMGQKFASVTETQCHYLAFLVFAQQGNNQPTVGEIRAGTGVGNPAGVHDRLPDWIQGLVQKRGKGRFIAVPARVEEPVDFKYGTTNPWA